MNYYRSAGLAVLFTALGLFAGVVAVEPHAEAAPVVYAYAPPPSVRILAPQPRTPVTDASVVKVTTTTGHGSGVNIGGGFIITAGHVAGSDATLAIKTASGDTATAEVLWVNKTYDLALLRTTNDIGAGAHLDCRTAIVGEQIEASGNPMNIEFISTYGRIAGNIREVGPWKEALLMDASIGPGMSGGPAFEANGGVIGIVVGGALAPVQSGVDAAGQGVFVPSMTGISMIVPSSTVCRLMARGAV